MKGVWIGLALTLLPAQAVAAAPPRQVTWESECDGVTRTVRTQLGAPRALDVCGSRAPDIRATLRATAEGLNLIAVRMSPSELPLKLSARFGPDTFGFDARESNAPDSFDGTASPGDLRLALQGGGPQLKVFFNETRFDLEGVPAQLRVRTSAQSLHVESDTVIDLKVRDGALKARVDRLPGSLAAEMTETGLTYRASAEADEFDFELTGLPGRGTNLDVSMIGVPTAADLNFRDLVFDGAIGTLRASLTDGSTVDFPSGVDALIVRDSDSQYVVAARINGLRRASFGSGFQMDLQTAGGRIFDADLRRGAQAISARIDRLPGALVMELGGQADGSVRYSHQASSVISSVQFEASDLPFTGRVRRASARLANLPASMEIGFGGPDGPLIAHTSGAIGSLEALLTSGPSASVPAGRDGVVLRDTPDSYVLAARVRDLRRIRLTQGSGFDALIDTAEGRPFTVQLLDIRGLTQLTVDSIPRSLRLTVADTNLTYAASHVADRLDLRSPAGDFTAVPAPSQIAVCGDVNGNSCGNANVPADQGSLRVTASGAAALALDLGQLLLDGLTTRRLELSVHQGDGAVAWLDTDDQPLRGRVAIGGVSGDFPSGTKAQDRLASASATQGTITCPNGFALRSGETDLTELLCSG